MDYRPLLIGTRLTLGLAFLIASGFCAIAYAQAKADSAAAGAAIGFIMTFASGIWFCDAGLAPDLWAPQWPPIRHLDHDDTELE